MSKKLRIVADSAIPFLEEALAPWVELVRLPGRSIAAAEVQQADALIVRTRTRCDEALLSGSSVKLVATATIGFDHIDTDYCRRAGISVATAAGCNARGVLQWVAGVLVEALQRRGARPQDLTLGVVGVGHVGSLVADYARCWGFRVLCCDPPRARREGFPSLPVRELAAACDIITFHTPLDDSTYHLCNAELLALLPKGALVINSSRGAVVDNAALLAAGNPCALDVWEGEPELLPELLAHAEVATSHIAGYSLQGKANATLAAVEAVARIFGLPLSGWYPAGVKPSAPWEIGWEELVDTIGNYFDPVAETLRLKASPQEFEQIRDHYPYRQEYF